MEVSVVFFAFVELPAGLINREVYQMNLSIFERHLIVDWGTYDSVHKFFRRFIALVCQLNHEALDCKAFNDAFEEFIQYLTYNKKSWVQFIIWTWTRFWWGPMFSGMLMPAVV